MLEQALAIYKSGSKYQNEMARTIYKLGRVRLDQGDSDAGESMLAKATELYDQLGRPRGQDELTETDFDNLIMAWSR